MRKDTEWYHRMLLRYGSDEAISKIMRTNGLKAKRQTGGGFRGFDTPEQIREISKKGVLARGHQWHQEDQHSNEERA